MPLTLIFLVIALVLFALSAFGVGGRINLQGAGLAFLTLAFMTAKGFL